LIRCGLPDFILQTESDWIHFLQEGFDVLTGWKSSLLSPDQQLELYTFIRLQYGNDTYRGVLRDLEKSLEIAELPKSEIS